MILYKSSIVLLYNHKFSFKLPLGRNILYRFYSLKKTSNFRSEFLIMYPRAIVLSRFFYKYSGFLNRFDFFLSLGIKYSDIPYRFKGMIIRTIMFIDIAENT